MKLYLVRHGVSTGNAAGRPVGQSGDPLSAEGEAQARAVAGFLAPLGPMGVHCSDLPRALQTAARIAAAWPGVEVHADRRLREIDLGDYDGRSWGELAADEALSAALEADPNNAPLPGGESVAALTARVLAAVEDIATAARGGEGRGAGLVGADREAIVLVTHDGPIRAILNTFLGVPVEKWWTLSTSHGGLSLIEWWGDWVGVRFVNATGHLAPRVPRA